MFDKKCTHDEAKVELRKYIDSSVQDIMSYYQSELKKIRSRLSDLERQKNGHVSFKYLERNLTITEAIARLKDGRAVRNKDFADNFYLVARFETHIKSKVVGYQIIDYISNDIISESYYLAPSGKNGCFETGWEVVDV